MSKGRTSEQGVGTSSATPVIVHRALVSWQKLNPMSTGGIGIFAVEFLFFGSRKEKERLKWSEEVPAGNGTVPVAGLKNEGQPNHQGKWNRPPLSVLKAEDTELEVDTLELEADETLLSVPPSNSVRLIPTLALGVAGRDQVHFGCIWMARTLFVESRYWVPKYIQDKLFESRSEMQGNTCLTYGCSDEEVEDREGDWGRSTPMSHSRGTFRLP
ncbi:hypothetical protein DFH07DRAFT_768829 [Mycena maculata]|uniref:Uncharacterized protein n=1 Tax=Mycena maculata TaxID=230809 RepID=A0AAD7NNW5_9AGAR|nr:hypothetical protein DFH07DRAFT_768829 [Mycena maculata]